MIAQVPAPGRALMALKLRLPLVRQFMKYGMVGFTGWLLGLAVIWIATDVFGFAYQVSFVFSGLAAYCCNFTLNKLWTFRR